MNLPSIASGPALGPAEPVLGRFDSWVRDTPDATAVDDAETRWSYAELNAEAARIADVLSGVVRPGDLVGVCVERSAVLVAIAVALAKLGAVYLPLGTRQGARRLAELCDRLGGLPLIASPAGVPATHQSSDLIPGHPLVFATTGETGIVAPDSACYAVLTSGSAGTPKTVVVGADSFARVVRWYTTASASGPGDRHSLAMSVPFDPHLLEMWAGLTSGATLVVPPESVVWDPPALIEWWRDQKISISVLPTPIGEEVLARPWPELPVLRHVIIGGDRLRRWPRREISAQMFNVYGPAEATIVTTVFTLDTDGSGAPPIGSPIDGVVVCVTDESGAILPRGAVGELCIGGLGLAIGYLDDELTAAKYGGLPGLGRVYRSGDRVRMRADGVLEFLGRIDDQVKVSGARIELTEVEQAFERDPRVAQAVAAIHETTEGLRRLVVFVLGTDRGTEADFLSAAREWLPEHEVPAAIHRVEAFPHTANGKIDRAALVAGLDARHMPTDDTALPDTERTLVQLCRTLLGVPDISVEDDFLGSGGTSMLAVRLMNAVETTFGVRLRAPEVLSQPDLRRLAGLIDERMGTKS